MILLNYLVLPLIVLFFQLIINYVFKGEKSLVFLNLLFTGFIFFHLVDIKDLIENNINTIYAVMFLFFISTLISVINLGDNNENSD